MKATVHSKDRAGHLMSSIGSEIQSRLCDVIRLADMADGYKLIHLGSLFG